MDVFEAIEAAIRQAKYSTIGLSHDQIFEIIMRKVDIVKTDKQAEEETK
jgi:hypothetical protein